MSLFSSISVMSSALRTFDRAVRVTSNNIANANTLGFTRRRVDLAENLFAVSDGFSLGSGVGISSITRMRDRFLDVQIRAQASQVGYYDALSKSMDELKAIFPDVVDPSSTVGIAGKLTSYYNAWTALAASPASNALKRAVIVAADALATQLRTTTQDLVTLRASLNDSVLQDVDQVNALLDQVAYFNGLIKQQGSAAGADLLDARDNAMKSLAGLTDFRFQQISDGTVTVYFNGGTLVNGSVATHLGTLVQGLPDPDLLKIGFPGDSSTPTDVTEMIRGGELGALLQVRDHTLEPAFMNIRALGTGLIENTNLIYHSAKSVSNAHINFFNGNSASDIQVNPSLATDVSGASLLTEFASGFNIGALATAMSRSQNMYASTYVQSRSAIAATADPTVAVSTLLSVPAFTASGTIVINLADGSSSSVAWTNTDTLNQICARINTALAGAGVAVFDETTKKMTLLISQQASLYDSSGNFCVATRLNAYLSSATNLNSASDPLVNPVAGSEVFSSNNGLLHYFTEADAYGTLTVDGNSVNWTDLQNLTTVDTNILAATGNISGAFSASLQRLILTRTIAVPTSVNQLKTFAVSDDTGNLAAVTALFAASTVSNRYTGIQADISGKVSVAEANRDASEAVQAELQGLQDDSTAIDVNEELANLSNYQRSYEAAVRAMTIIDQMLNVLINHTATPSSSVDSGAL